MKKTSIKAIADMKNIQGQNGNWNYDPYMLGLYNGLEMAHAILEDREPVFKYAPKRWLHDSSILGKLKHWWFTRVNPTQPVAKGTHDQS